MSRTSATVRYVVLPGILPRLLSLLSVNSRFLAPLVASLFAMVRLLPAGHAYLHPVNAGRFGVLAVIGETARRLVFSREHIDQILVFFLILAGMLILLFQFVVLGVFLMVAPAQAFGLIPDLGLSDNFFDFFVTQNPEKDVAFSVLDLAFGIEDWWAVGGSFFGSDHASVVPWPNAYHNAMWQVFAFYSNAILLFAVIIFLYYVFVVVLETTQTGTPFGRRFNVIWAPFRLIAAFGLLIPLGGQGFNSAQMIVLSAAKYGSGMGTNGWVRMNEAISDIFGNMIDPVGEAKTDGGFRYERMVPRVNVPNIRPLVEFIHIVKTCAYAYDVKYGIYPEAYVFDRTDSEYLTYDWNPADVDTMYEKALDYNNKGDIVIRFGEKSDEYKNDAAHVHPYCGEIIVPTTSYGQPGADLVQKLWLYMVNEMWYADDDFIGAYAIRMGDIYLNSGDPCAIGNLDDPIDGGALADDNCKYDPPPSYIIKIVQKYQGFFDQIAEEGRFDLITSDKFDMTEEVLRRGWGGAGIWFNRLAQYNGAYVAAVMNIPYPKTYPEVMEKVLDARRKGDQMVQGPARFDLNISDGFQVQFSMKGDDDIARVLSQVYRNWHSDGVSNLRVFDENVASLDYNGDGDSTDKFSVDNKLTGNLFFDVINAVFGETGLLTMRKNRDVFPLAQMVGVGKGLIESSIRNLLVGAGTAALGGAAEILNPHIGGGLQAASSVFVSLSTIGLIAGFVLFYIIPTLPFIYFFFAVGRWVKTIFEALVGMPLWALSHLRIDGDGFPTQQSMDGYFLILEIFLRPILTVFGLLAAVGIFTASALVMNDIFSLVSENLSGFAPDDLAIADIGIMRGPVDEFMFSILYVLVIYFMATSMFKLIDDLPDQILRWIGSSASGFADDSDKQAAGFIVSTLIGGSQITGRATQAIQGMGKATGYAAGGVLELAGKLKK